MCHPGGGGLLFFKWDSSMINPLPMDELYVELTLSLATNDSWSAKDIETGGHGGDPVRQDCLRTLWPATPGHHCDTRRSTERHNRLGELWVERQTLAAPAILRRPYGTLNTPFIAEIWNAIKFEPEVEEAYAACWDLVRERDYD